MNVGENQDSHNRILFDTWPKMDCDALLQPQNDEVEEVLRAVADVCARRRISALDGFLEGCRHFAREEVLNVAVLGRFKAGKSSFLNHVLGRPLLPVGVVPVTSVITEIEWGTSERVEVVYADGAVEKIPAERISDFVSESANPENSKHVARVRVTLPSMERYRGIRFVDTPGLESVFEHNTETSLDWLPNVGLALVAVGVDPPLSQRDLDLIGRLARVTPRISILLTKVDVISEGERTEVLEFIERQLERSGSAAVPVFPFSIRDAFRELTEQLDEKLLLRTRAGLADQHRAVLRHKMCSLLDECKAWLEAALKAAETADSERQELREKIVGQPQALEDTRLGLKLIVRHAQGAVRSAFEALLKRDEAPIRRRLSEALDREFSGWARNLSAAVAEYEEWAQASLWREMADLSAIHYGAFLEPLQRVNQQLEQALQDFRNRVSARVLETLGVPLQTKEMELRVEMPTSPDIRIGRTFDRSWELLSWLVPMTLVRGAVRRHFQRKTERLVMTNLSRLTSQWESVVNSALAMSEKEAVRRLNVLVASIGELTQSNGSDVELTRSDIATITRLGARLRVS